MFISDVEPDKRVAFSLNSDVLGEYSVPTPIPEVKLFILKSEHPNYNNQSETNMYLDSVCLCYFIWIIS